MLLKSINFAVLEETLTLFITDFVQKNGFKNGIVGVSGGIDSAVVLALTKKALGAGHVFALLMPHQCSAEKSLRDGQDLCRKLKVSFETVDITEPVDGYFRRFPSVSKVQFGNKCARERMAVLYDFSIRKQALVIGTSNKSEMLIGYTTLFGDSAAACYPVGDVYKTQIFELARHMDLPKEIIDKTPSADLWEDQTDEGEIGMSYDQLDHILYSMVDEMKSAKEIEQMGYPKKTVDKVSRMIVQSQYKRTLPPVAKVQNRTIGIDFRYLRDWDK